MFFDVNDKIPYLLFTIKAKEKCEDQEEIIRSISTIWLTHASSYSMKSLPRMLS